MGQQDEAGVRELLTQRWPAIEASAGRLRLDAGGTLARRGDDVSSTRRLHALAQLLPRLSGTAPGRVELHDVLGQGGMGLVRRGTQVSLDRVVAVKTVREDRRGDDATLKLLQEAYIAGALEHPNVVPVHDIARADDGEPQILLRRIEGVAWSELIDDPDAVRARFGVLDPLEWHLRVFLQVCNAVHHAHERGFVHLDIKPANVMIGPFGEVLLVDWGLAMALVDDGTGRLPLLADCDELFGTPSYLAPEVLTQDGRLLGRHTDVYLLGATLFHAVSGRPPHVGPNPLAILYAVATGPTPTLPDAPDELRAICAGAMATEPAERPPSADALRAEVQRFLEHRGALRLVDEADAEAGRLDALLAAEDPAEAELRARFAAARFGYESAQKAWPACPRAARGKGTLFVAMARHELRRDEPRAAAALLAEMIEPPAELVDAARLALQARDGTAQRIAALEQLADQQDPRIGQRTRVFVVGILGVLWTGLPLYRAISPLPPGDEAWLAFAGSAPVFAVVFAALVLWARDSLTKTAVNRRTVASVFTLFVFQTLLVATAWRAGVPVDAVLPLFLVLWGLTATMAAIGIDRRLLPTSLALVAALGVTLAHPPAGWWAAATANLAFFVNGLVAWWPPPARVNRDGRRDPDPPSAGRSGRAT